MMITVESSNLLVYIPAAGRGSRASGTSHLPKPLITVGGIPLILRVMMQYPSGTQFIIALGFKAEWVKQVVSYYAKNREIDVEFVITDSWQYADKGLAHTILDSKEFLIGRPFIFHAVDGLFSESAIKSVSSLNCNAIVMCPPCAPAVYRTLDENKWVRIECDAQYELPVYTGLAVIWDSKTFFINIEFHAENNPEGGETIGLDPKGLKVIALVKNEWRDFGTTANIELNSKEFPSVDVILEKSNEAIWGFDGRMLKFHESPSFVSNRVVRASNLAPFVPEVRHDDANLFSYERIKGTTLSRDEASNFSKLLKFLEDFWFGNLHKLTAVSSEESDFIDFYKTKTFARVMEFKKKYPEYDVRVINGVKVRCLDDLLAAVDWPKLCSPEFVRTHGDLHPDNIIVTHDDSQFRFLDWRQDIAGMTSGWGDLYYDLGKLRHGLIVDHEVVSKGEFEVIFDNLGSFWTISQSDKKRQWLQEIDIFIQEQKFDIQRSRVMTALIFINIACLHHEPYDMFLMLLGHSLLFETTLGKDTQEIDSSE